MPRAIHAFCIVVGGTVVLAAVFFLSKPPSRFSMVMLGLCALTLVLIRYGRARARLERMSESPPLPSAEDLVAAIEAEEEQTQGLSCVAFEFPRLVCSPAEFDSILARHEALVRAHLSALTFLTRRETNGDSDVPFDAMHWYAAEINARGGAQRLEVSRRVATAKRYASFSAIAHRVADFPGRECMHVVVMDDDAVSVRKVDLLCVGSATHGAVHRELVLVREEVTFEPVRHELERREGGWVQAWRATATSPLHEERVTVRPPARSEEECLDRLFIACEEKLRDALEYAKEMGRPMGQSLFWCGPGWRFGPYGHALAYERADWPDDLLECWPRCDMVLRHPWPPEWVPVFVTRGPIGGIRWAALDRGTDERTRPASVTERKAGATRPVRRFSAMDRRRPRSGSLSRRS